jgi:hypothetical protein
MRKKKERLSPKEENLRRRFRRSKFSALVAKLSDDELQLLAYCLFSDSYVATGVKYWFTMVSSEIAHLSLQREFNARNLGDYRRVKYVRAL